jgi:hypothetical protein
MDIRFDGLIPRRFHFTPIPDSLSFFSFSFDFPILIFDLILDHFSSFLFSSFYNLLIRYVTPELLFLTYSLLSDVLDTTLYVSFRFVSVQLHRPIFRPEGIVTLVGAMVMQEVLQLCRLARLAGTRKNLKRKRKTNHLMICVICDTMI